MMKRRVRYQGAIMRGSWLLLIQHCEHDSGRRYWLLPGGGLEEPESEEECVQREMREETGLEVRVLRLLLHEDEREEGIYLQRKTYLCEVISGAAAPGYEPEEEAARHYSISQVAWFDLADSSTWEEQLLTDPITSPQLQELQRVLGYI